MQSRRLALIKIPCSLLEAVLRGDWSKVTKDATGPADLNIIRIFQPLDHIGQCFCAICESKAFDEVPEGQSLPYFVFYKPRKLKWFRYKPRGIKMDASIWFPHLEEGRNYICNGITGQE